MNNQLKNIIDQYKNDLLETRNLQISNEKFLTEVICDERLDSSSFKNLTLINLNFTNIDFESSFFKEYLFKNCIFESISFQDAEFESCHFIETNFNGFDFGSLIATAVENSNFSKFNKSIEFKGKFFLIDILQSETGLEGMLLEH